MNFLNPIFLLALIAVAVPLLIHLFSRRRVPDVPFPTLRFLRRSDRRIMRWINIRRLLLLILRMAGVALIALTFARPVVRGGLAALFPPGGSRTACILIDRSYSMGVEEDEGTLFERAKARLAQILDHLGREDEVAVVLFDLSPEIFYRGRFERGAIVDPMENTVPSWSGTDLRNAVNGGMTILGTGRAPVRELYIISDFQRTGVSGAKDRHDNESVPAGTDGEREKPGENDEKQLPVRTFLLPVQPEQGPNVAIERTLTPRITLHVGELATLTVVLRNTSMDLAARFPLEVSLDGRRIIEKEIEIPPGGTHNETFEFPVDRVGWIRGDVKKRKDRLLADDRRYFALHVQEKVNVLLIADESGFYLAQALSPEEVDGDIQLNERNWRNVTSSDLDAVEAVVLGPGGGPSVRDIELLDRFVSSGGKAMVLIIPELREVIGSLSGYNPEIVFRETGEGFVTIAVPRVLPGFLSPFDEEDIEALIRLRFKRTAVVGGIPDIAVLLKFRTGAPFMWEERHGDGTLIFTAIDPVPEAGEIVLSPFFLPLVQQVILATGPEPPTGEGYMIGEPIPWRDEVGSETRCTLPDGVEVRPGRMDNDRPNRGGRKPARQSDGEILIPPVSEPGFVTIYDGGDVSGMIAVNPECREESDLTVMSAREAADSLGLTHWVVVEDRQEFSSEVGAAREGREISTLLLLAAAAILVGELIVAQRERGEIPE